MFIYNLKEFIYRHRREDDSDVTRFFETLKRLNLKENKAWLAGGSIRRLIDGTDKEGDYDLFFSSEQDLDSMLNKFKDKIKKRKDNQLNITIWLNNGQKLQFIRMYYPSPQNVIDSFDFTLCQFITDGELLYVGEYTLFDVGRRYCSPHVISYPASSMRRMLKYAGQGYTVCDGSIRAVALACQATDNPFEIVDGFSGDID